MRRPIFPGSCYVVCVGINQYLDSSQMTELAYAQTDAAALHTLLLELGVPPHNSRLLLGEDATLDAVNDALDFILDQPHRSDLVIFYFAGHSIPIALDEETSKRSELFLATYDFDRQKIKTSRAFRLRYALGMERLRRDFFEGEGSRQRLFIFDSCYSGDFYGPGYRGESDAPNPAQEYIRQTLWSANVGRVALSSCLPTQRALEDPELGHGRFTYYLLEALRGTAENAVRRDGWLTVASLFDYLADQMPEDQRPVLSGVQHDQFRLVYFPDKTALATKREGLAEHGGGMGWDEVVNQSRQRSERFLREVRGTAERPGAFIPEVYVHREDAEAQLHSFLGSQAAGLILVGDSGIGKTNLLCWWTEALLEAGHAVFIYGCGVFYEPDI